MDKQNPKKNWHWVNDVDVVDFLVKPFSTRFSVFFKNVSYSEKHPKNAIKQIEKKLTLALFFVFVKRMSSVFFFKKYDSFESDVCLAERHSKGTHALAFLSTEGS
jgi:hypothetical protein